VLLRPTPETLEALGLFEEQGDPAVAVSLDDCVSRASAIVPDLIALSLTLLDAGLTFTMTRGDPGPRVSGEPIRSSLALPLFHHGLLCGIISLYAAAPAAFDGREADVAKAVGSTAMTTLAPVSRDNRPDLVAQRIREHDVIDQAVGFMASANDTGVEDAEELLRRNAGAAGQSDIHTAEAVLARQRD
jgi:GAF domain-containing protein